MDLTVFSNCHVFDGVSEDIPGGMSVVIEGDQIREVSHADVKLKGAKQIDCGGRFLMPGLIDLHFHAYSITFDIQRLDRMPKPLLASYAIRHLEATLQRGFTTIRDPGGGDIGLALAIEEGLVNGPRFLYGGKALSQTGGHGDMRPGHQEDLCHCAYSGVITQIVDGPDQVRRVARDELRKGADHIKVFISGGVASPTDPFWMPQFTDAEIQAAVQEAQSRRKYVVAHCHTDDGAQRCVRNGIRSIDHATIISDETANMIADSGTSYTVPTLAVMQQLNNHGAEVGLFPSSVDKVKGILGKALTSIEACTRAGVKIGLGTDIFGTEYHDMQASEFRFRAEVNKPIDILRSATSINAEIIQRDKELGRIEPGYCADLIVLNDDPLKDLSIFEQYRTQMPVIMRQGQFIRQEI